MKKLLSALFLLTFFFNVRFAESAPNGLDLYRQGKPEAAKAAFLAELKSADAAVQKSGTIENKSRQWDALMSLAWFLDETGEHREAIRYSNQALDIGYSVKQPFLIGRSLAWLGWAYTSLGLYDMASEFYTQALKYGAPKGVPEIPMVWGIAKQELGYLFFKMGDVANAKLFLEETTKFARDNGILIGVAEGGVRLAEIWLEEGNLGQATLAATEAREAAIKCNCTPFTLLHAKTTLASIAIEKAKRDAAMIPQARALIDEFTQEAKSLGVKRFIAEGQILEAKLIPAQEFEKKYDLIREAYESLETMESERRGDAEQAVGNLFLDQANTDLAKFYLEHGVKANEAMLRTIHKSLSTQDLAHLDGMRGDRHAVLNKLQKSFDEALSTKSYPVALESAEQLFRELSQLGYNSLAAKWGKEAIKLYDTMIAAEIDEHAKATLQRKRVAALEEMSENSLEIAPLPASPPSPN